MGWECAYRPTAGVVGKDGDGTGEGKAETETKKEGKCLGIGGVAV